MTKFPRRLWSKTVTRHWDTSRARKHALFKATALLLITACTVGLLIMQAATSGAQTQDGLLKEILPLFTGALLGTAVSLWVSNLLATDLDLINIVAEGTQRRGLIPQDELVKYQRLWHLYHVTRTSIGHDTIGRGFFWIHYRLDLSAPCPGKLLGTAQTVDPRTDPSGKERIDGAPPNTSFIAEGFLHDGMMTLYLLPCDGKEVITATFTFPYLSPPDYVQYGTGTYMTFAGAGDVINGSGILSPDALTEQGKLGRLGNDDGCELERLWWKGYRLKFLPGIQPQISRTYARMPELNGRWRARYVRVYADRDTWYECRMEIRSTEARILIWPVTGHYPLHEGGQDASSTRQNRGWVAECTAVHDFALQGRWWGVDLSSTGIPDAPGGGSMVDVTLDQAETLQMTKTEGALSLAIYEDFAGLVGFFSGHMGSRSSAFSPLILVREETMRQDSSKMDQLVASFLSQLPKSPSP
ncbi:MAG: hypothetical protein NDI67_12440 [Sulfuritalea sp.]|nr:hypothetical protein [Sulfuritalea sp.]